MNDITIRAHQLTLRHNDVKVLDSVSLDIPAGVVVGLVGRKAPANPRCCAAWRAWPRRTAAALRCWTARRCN